MGGVEGTFQGGHGRGFNFLATSCHVFYCLFSDSYNIFNCFISKAKHICNEKLLSENS